MRRNVILCIKMSSWKRKKKCRKFLLQFDCLNTLKDRKWKYVKSFKITIFQVFIYYVTKRVLSYSHETAKLL